MATTVDDLVVKFTADISGLSKGLDKANAQFARLEKTVDKTSGRMSSQIGGLGRLFKLDLLIRYGSQLIRLEDQMEQLASTIKDTSDRADIGAESLQKLRHVADQNGTSAEAMDSALIRLNKAMGLARLGAEGMREIFAAMGLEELIVKGATTEEMFYAIADSVSQFKDESKASAVVAKIMGREADRLIETFKLGGDEARRVAEALRGVIPQETIDKLDAARDRTEEFKKVLSAMGADAAGLFIDLVAGVRDVIAWLDQQLDAVNRLSAAWRGLKEFWGGTGVLNQPLGPPPSGFTKGGRGFLEPGTADVRSPVFSTSTIKPNEKALGNLLGGGGASSAAKKASDDAARAAEAYRDVVSDLTFEIEQLGLAEGEAAYQQDLRAALSSAGVTLESDRGQAIKELVDQLRSAKDAQAQLAAGWEVEAANANRALQEMNAAMDEYLQKWQQIGDTIEDSVAGAFVDMAANMSDAREIIAELIADMGKLIAKALILQAVQGITNSIFGDGGIGAALSGKAMGGLVNAGNAYMVGERGPELFVPKVGGNIIPNGRAGGGGTVVSINSHVNVPGGTSKAEFQRMLSERDRALVPAVLAAVDDKIRKSNSYGTRR